MDDNKLFQISVKGLYFDENDRLMMIQGEDDKKDDSWEIVGGRVEKGEDLIECLKRECREEIGLDCEVLDSQPCIAYTAIDQVGFPRVMLFYKIRLNNLNFTPSDECVAVNFFSKEEIRQLNLVSQLQRLVDFL